MPDAPPTSAIAAEPRRPAGLAGVLAWLPGWRDVACLLVVLAATLYLVGEDGGRPYRAMLPVLILAIPATVAVVPTLRRLPRWALAVTIASTLGPLLALLLADVRAGWVRPVASLAVFVPVMLATLHLLRRRWGSTAIVAIVGLTLAWSWSGGLLGWWGGSSSQGQPAWMVLSWHNQSGTLMAVLGIGALGIALDRTRWSRLVAVPAAAAGLAAAWLSGSRAVVACVAVAVLVVLVARVRQQLDRAAWVTPLVIAGLTVLLVVGLSAIYGDATSTGGADGGGLASQPVTSREQGALHNLQARVGHWQAAVGMFATAPLTGTGPGSYARSSVPVYPDDTNRTASAHGEQIEALGEMGLLGGGAVVVVSLLLAWAVLRTLHRPGRRDLQLAAAGGATLLVSHAALDFDWEYPLLVTLLAIATAVLADTHLPHRIGASLHDPDDARPPDPDEAPSTDPDEPPPTKPDPPQRPDGEPAARSTSDRTLVATAGLGTVLLAGAAIAGVIVQIGDAPPWEVRGALAEAMSAATEDPQLADARLAQLERWNPGEPRLPDVRRLVAHQRGELTDEQLATSVDPRRMRFGDQLQAAEQLLANDRPELAQPIVDQLRPVLDQRRAWGVAASVAHATSLSLSIADDAGGCSDVEEVWAELGPWAATYGVQVQMLEGAAEVVAACGLTTPPAE